MGQRVGPRWALIIFIAAFAKLFYSEEARVWSERLGCTKALGQMKEALQRLYQRDLSTIL